MSFWSCYRNKFRCKFLAPPVFDLTGVRYKIIKRNNINTLFKKELAKTGTGLKEGIHSQDEQYLLYSEDTIRKVSRLFPAMYNHQKFLSGKIDNAGEGWDCDNSAEYRSYWFHRLLPSCCAISVSQPGHRFMGVITLEEKIVWFNGKPDKCDYVYHVVY